MKTTTLGIGPTAGDGNCDGLMDISDMLVLRQSYGMSSDQPDYDQDADFNGDTIVDIVDFLTLKNTFGRSAISTPTGVCVNH